MEQDSFTGQEWFYGKERTTDTTMGTMNIRRSLSYLHAEYEILTWTIQCIKFIYISEVVFATDYSQLVKIVSTFINWPAFTSHIKDDFYDIPKKKKYNG